MLTTNGRTRSDRWMVPFLRIVQFLVVAVQCNRNTEKRGAVLSPQGYLGVHSSEAAAFCFLGNESLSFQEFSQVVELSSHFLCSCTVGDIQAVLPYL